MAPGSRELEMREGCRHGRLLIEKSRRCNDRLHRDTGVPGGRRKAGRAFRKTHQDKVGSRCYLVEKVLRGRGMSNRRDERSGLCCDRRHVVLKTEVGAEGGGAGVVGRGWLILPRHPELCSEDQCMLQGARLSARGEPVFNFQRLVFKFIFFS